MAETSGVVQEVQTRSVAGGKTAYNVLVAGQSYGAGLYAPKCKVGDFVKFEVDESRAPYKNIGRNSLRVSANKPPADAVAEAAATAPKMSSTGGSFDTRQDAISRQAASNTAISYMQLLQSVGGLAVPATKGKVAEAVDAQLHEYERSFYERNTGIAWKDISPAAKGDPEVAGTPASPDPEDNWT